MKIFICIILLFAVTACTYSINMVHTQGQADDVVDETDTITPSTNLSVTVSLVPKTSM